MTVDVLDATEPLDLEVVDAAIEVLRSGGLVVTPTDTVYGVICALEPSGGIERIFEIKGRTRDAALPVLVGTHEQARALGKFGAVAERLAAAWWPGPLTLVVERRAGSCPDLGGDSTSVGIRMPDSEIVKMLCARVGPLASSSANLSGRPDPEGVAEAIDALGDSVDLYLDGGGRGAGLPSTVIDARGALTLLRAGAIEPGELGL